MANNPSVVTRLSVANTQDLVTAAETRLWKYPEPSEEVELHAPFVDWAGVKRPVFTGDTKFASPDVCKVGVGPNGPGTFEISLDVLEGEMGRPVFGLIRQREATSYFGDQEGGETFTGLSLLVATSGLAYMAGRSPMNQEPTILDKVTEEELYIFGRAIFDAVEIHEARNPGA